jgi:hypothetical protein
MNQARLQICNDFVLDEHVPWNFLEMKEVTLQVKKRPRYLTIYHS